MWFMNKIANPFVRLILRSPLHGMLSAALLLITYRGKKSGKDYTLPVQYAEIGKSIYVVPGLPGQKTWWRNLKGGLPVKLILRGQTVSGDGRVLVQPEDVAEIARGLAAYLQKFPTLAKSYNVRTAGAGFDADDLHNAAMGVVMIRVDSE